MAEGRDLRSPGPARDEPSVGARCVTTRRIGFVDRPVTSEITRIDPPRRWGIKGVDGPIRARWTWWSNHCRTAAHGSRSPSTSKDTGSDDSSSRSSSSPKPAKRCPKTSSSYDVNSSDRSDRWQPHLVDQSTGHGLTGEGGFTRAGSRKRSWARPRLASTRLRPGRGEDAVDRVPQSGVKLGVALVHRQPFGERPREAGDQAMVCGQTEVRLALAVSAERATTRKTLGWLTSSE